MCYVAVADTHAAMADMAAAFYDHPSRELHLVGVTGTNGKTTVATLLYDLFRRLGYEAGLISTVVYRVGERRIASTHTTPDVIRLNALMREMVDAGCAYCFMEVSSHAIVQERIRGLHFEGGIFTNITHDHLDYHKTFAAYIEAKKLFFDRLPAGAFALTNADDRNGRVMVQNTRARVAAYSLRSAADFTGRVLEQHLDGMLLRLGGDEVWVGFLGRFNASNLLAVYGAALLLGADRSEVLTAMSCLRPVSGRLRIRACGRRPPAMVDYAHTPDALENVLRTLGELLTGDGQLIAVCGCGGDRDRTKRPEMAAMAVKYAATAIFTSDNPRHEDPESILDEMVAGLPPKPVTCASPTAAKRFARRRCWPVRATSCCLPARDTKPTRSWATSAAISTTVNRSNISFPFTANLIYSAGADRHFIDVCCIIFSNISTVLTTCPVRACSSTSRSARRWPSSWRCSLRSPSDRGSSASCGAVRSARRSATSASKASSRNGARPPWAA